MNAKVTVTEGEKKIYDVEGFENIEAGQIFTLFKSASDKLVAAFLTARLIAIEIPENAGTTVLTV